MSVAQTLRSQPSLSLLAMALLCVCLIGLLDYFTGYQVSLFVFYALPILFTVWFLDRKSTVAVVLASALVWWWTDRKAGHLYFATWVSIWETVVRLLFFTFVAMGGIALKSRRDSMMALVANMGRMRELERDIVAASEREQQRIGADLHDGLCQYLAGVSCVTRSLHSDLEKLCPSLVGTAEELHELLECAVVQARNIARGIAPVHMSDAGLHSALDELARTTRKLQEIDCQFFAEGETGVADHEIATHLYRIAQEATSNAVRHGHATAISIRLVVANREVALSVCDNGTGIAEPESLHAGMGLRSMRYRAGLLQGKIDISALPERGVCVRCAAPLPAAAPAAAAPLS